MTQYEEAIDTLIQRAKKVQEVRSLEHIPLWMMLEDAAMIVKVRSKSS